MKRLLKLTWLRLRNLVKIPQPVRISLRDKAIAVAGRVSVVKVRDSMQKKKDSVLHLPSLVVGVGIAAGVGVLLTFLAKNRAQALVGNTVRQPRFKER
ncbi:uncharacterized protein LOC113768737 isoform X2 [Coffea eugenioides]|uniref:uncharacterized protein LOC113755869 isoform X2 n=1 Tax=Coffea eugenioides TaxID=49369 RepID=UPI000F61394D|nr:uncharacterized protein LOC113755869 isoform X2 [Coffea eugenioides]XP_027168999.1 uncharacterized protein LOC113768737 isoform X2 [Coffea eugenioides]